MPDKPLKNWLNPRVVDSMTLVGERMQVVNIFKEPEDYRVQRKNAGGRKQQKQQTKCRERENAEKQLSHSSKMLYINSKARD